MAPQRDELRQCVRRNHCSREANDSGVVTLPTLPEYRTDPISGETVIIAPSRIGRPNALAALRSGSEESQKRDEEAADCPFCRGREDQTPNTLAAYPSGASHDDWQVRVVDNLYPAVTNANAHGEPDGESAIAAGQHEVVIEGPGHVCSLSELSADQLLWTMQAYADRMLAHRDNGAVYTQVFKNNGRAAGASLQHAHSQIISLDRVPDRVQRELNSCGKFAGSSGACLICDVIRREVEAGDRVVLESNDWVVYCPYASRLPFELCIAPRQHQPHFCSQNESELGGFSRTLYQTVALLEKMENRLPFNYLIHTAPFDMKSEQPYHWHMEMVPRLACKAGFEWGTGLHLNPVAPEAAASELRNLIAD